MRLFFAVAVSICGLLAGSPLAGQSDVTARLLPPQVREAKAATPSRSAVLWLEPLAPSVLAKLPWPPHAKYQLLQKNKMFSPHLLVVPVGASVTFPNADPFFHNVFSLFDGKRFDLGLYEAGASRDVRFERSGVSYIFCNIHPDMGAVVLALDTPLWAVAEPKGTFRIADVPAGVYDVHLWLEGEDEETLNRWTHRIAVAGQGSVDAGEFQAKPRQTGPHLDKFGHPYKPTPADY